MKSTKNVKQKVTSNRLVIMAVISVIAVSAAAYSLWQQISVAGYQNIQGTSWYYKADKQDIDNGRVLVASRMGDEGEIITIGVGGCNMLSFMAAKGNMFPTSSRVAKTRYINMHKYTLYKNPVPEKTCSDDSDKRAEAEAYQIFDSLRKK